MPFKPKKPCAYPGCPNLTHEKYCEQHKKDGVPYDKLKEKEYDKSRAHIHKKRYNKQWESVRNAYIRSHPLCERCYAQHIATSAEIVHHIVPLSEGGSNSVDNLMSVCRKCHAQVHVERGDRFGWMKGKSNVPK